MRRYAVLVVLAVLAGLVVGAVAVEAAPAPKAPTPVEVTNDAANAVPVEVTNPLAAAGPEVVSGSGTANGFDFVALPAGVVFTDFVWSARQNPASTTPCSNPYVTYRDDVNGIGRVPAELHLISGVTGANPEFIFSADGPGCQFDYFWSGYTVTP